MTPFQMTEADIKRAREIVALHVDGKPVATSDHVVLAVARGMAEGRQQGIKEGVKMTTASNDA
ncbi:hypothetical protein LJR220_004999 [Bradyrhizobium sp. LjRoot220]|uniref:hypothetical protein n=1 Tax=Bradyrhizobium sp. LjRoot220 TaxID=3342284 RepID=UPI003ED0E8CE